MSTAAVVEAPEREPCTLVRGGTTCGRPATFHVLTWGPGYRVAGWLCMPCGTWALQYGSWAKLHSMTDACTEGSCGLLDA